MRRVLVNVVDNIFVIFVMFLFNFLWCRYFFNLGIGLVISFILTTILSLLFLYVKSNKQGKQVSNSKKEREIKDVKNFITFNTLEKTKKLFVSKLNAVFVNNNICNINNKFYHLFSGVLKLANLIEILKENKSENCSIICAEAEKDVFEVVKSIEKPAIEIVQAKELVIHFNLNLEGVESAVLLKSEKRFSFKEFLQLFVREENAKGYLMGSIVLMVSTLIIKLKIYYYIFISILLILSLVCKFKSQILYLIKNRKS